MKITIEITQDNINNGLPSNEISCPIAQAMQQKDNITYASVEGGTILYRTTETDDQFYPMEIHTSPAIQKFIENFDNEETVTPRTMIIDENNSKAYFKRRTT